MGLRASNETQRGSLLELSWGGKGPLTLDAGKTRTFLEDGDTLTLLGQAHGDGHTIGFGECTGKLLPALQRVWAFSPVVPGP